MSRQTTAGNPGRRGRAADEDERPDKRDGFGGLAAAADLEDERNNDLALDEEELRYELGLAVDDLVVHWEDRSIVEHMLDSSCVYPTDSLPSTAQWKRSSLSKLDYIRRLELEMEYEPGTMLQVLTLARDLIQTLATRIATEHVRRAREPAGSAPAVDAHSVHEPTAGKAPRLVSPTLESISPQAVASEYVGRPVRPAVREGRNTSVRRPWPARARV